MKTVGLLGGMSWESTIGYYRKINEGVKKALGEDRHVQRRFRAHRKAST